MCKCNINTIDPGFSRNCGCGFGCGCGCRCHEIVPAYTPEVTPAVSPAQSCGCGGCGGCGACNPCICGVPAELRLPPGFIAI